MYFHTATICNWQTLLEGDEPKEIVVQSLKWLVKNNLAHIHGFVIMPNHLHVLWSPAQNVEIEIAATKFSSYTGSMLKKHLVKNHPNQLHNYASSQSDREHQIWERRPRSLEVMSRTIAQQKLDYIHNNPLQGKWSLCLIPEEYKYSSASFYFLNSTRFDFLSHYADFC
ncbi:MAG: transposase [Bacteroidia bacterium]|nr:transposase [Bacteroidia bacterium]